jgi:hypothetical protein
MVHAIDQTLADIKALKETVGETRPSEEFLKGCEYAMNTLLIYLTDLPYGAEQEVRPESGQVCSPVHEDGTEQGTKDSEGSEEAGEVKG